MTRSSDIRTEQADPDASDRCEVDLVHADEVRRALDAQPTPQDVDRAVEVLGLLANPTRLRLLAALAGAGDPRPSLCVCDLAVVARASDSMTSHQLRALRLAGLVTQRREGRLVYYRIADDPVVRAVVDAIARRP